MFSFVVIKTMHLKKKIVATSNKQKSNYNDNDNDINENKVCMQSVESTKKRMRKLATFYRNEKKLAQKGCY